MLTAATKAQFDRLNCAHSNWKTQIYGTNPNNWDNPKIQVVTCYQGIKYALDKAVVTGQELKLGGSSAALQSTGDWDVDLTFNGPGGSGVRRAHLQDVQPVQRLQHRTAELLRDRAGRHAGLGRLRGERDHHGHGQIQGTFTESQADNLANVLNYGALPLSFQLQSQQTVSAQLGSSQLQAGPARRGRRAVPRGGVRVPLLPGPGHRRDLQPRDLGAADLPVAWCCSACTRTSRCRWPASRA